MPQAAAKPIEIQTDKVARLFHTLDPLPFRERDLDREAEEFIVGWARELPKAAPIEIVVHLPPAEAEGAQAADLANAMHSYFSYRADGTAHDMHELFRLGRYSLAIGVVVLAACIGTGSLVLNMFGENQITRFVNEGLIILGWVANWRPIEIFLYDWWPLVRRRRLYRRLAKAKVTLRPSLPDQRKLSAASTAP
jgi:hypothetical protein